MGNLYKNAENDHNGMNRMALKQAIKLKNMDPLKRAGWMRAFDVLLPHPGRRRPGRARARI